MKNYMLRIGVSSTLDEDALEEAIENALDAVNLDHTIYEVVEVEEHQQWSLAVKEVWK